MAKQNDTSTSRASRSRAASKARSPANSRKPADKAASIASLGALEDTIEEERARLMQAHSILNCVAIAMDAEDISPGDGPHYPTLIETACDLINESISGLDSMHLGRAMNTQRDDADGFEEALTAVRGGKNEVREPSPVYGQRAIGSGSLATDDKPVMSESQLHDELGPKRTVN